MSLLVMAVYQKKYKRARINLPTVIAKADLNQKLVQYHSSISISSLQGLHLRKSSSSITFIIYITS